MKKLHIFTIFIKQQSSDVNIIKLSIRNFNQIVTYS